MDCSLEEPAGEALEGLAKVDDDSVGDVADVTVSASLVAKNLECCDGLGEEECPSAPRRWVRDELHQLVWLDVDIAYQSVCPARKISRYFSLSSFDRGSHIIYQVVSISDMRLTLRGRSTHISQVFSLGSTRGVCGEDLLLGNFKNHGHKLEQLHQDVGPNVTHDLVRLIHKRTDNLGVGAVLAGDGSVTHSSLSTCSPSLTDHEQACCSGPEPWGSHPCAQGVLQACIRRTVHEHPLRELLQSSLAWFFGDGSGVV